MHVGAWKPWCSVTVLAISMTATETNFLKLKKRNTYSHFIPGFKAIQ